MARLRIIPGARERDFNPTDELNVGIVEIDPARAPTCVRLSLVGPTDGGAGVVYQSSWI